MDIIEILNNLSLESNIKLEEVPEIDLYMDQVIQLFESKLSNQKRNDEEKMAAIVGMGVNAMGFSVNNAIDILTNITSVFTEQELKIAHIVISYDYSSATTAVSNFINGLEY